MRPQSWSNPIFLAFSSIMKGSQEAACCCWRLPRWWITSLKNLRWKVAWHDKSPWPKIHPPDLTLSETESVSHLYITHFGCIPMFPAELSSQGTVLKPLSFIPGDLCALWQIVTCVWHYCCVISEMTHEQMAVPHSWTVMTNSPFWKVSFFKPPASNLTSWGVRSGGRCI